VVLDVDCGVLLPRRHRAPLEGRALAPDGRGRVPVLRSDPAHGGDLGRPAHHALLSGVHARDRRRPRGASPELPAHEVTAGDLGQRELRPAAGRASQPHLVRSVRGRGHLPFLRGDEGPHPPGHAPARLPASQIAVAKSAKRPDIAPLVRDMLAGVGEDPNREGLVKTPERVEKALKFLTRGYEQDPAEILNAALFTVTYDEMVVVKDI